MNDLLLYNKLKTLPEYMKSEVADFIDSLLNKAQKNNVAKNNPKPKFGSGKGTFKMKADFDEPLEDFKEYMGNE